MRKTAELAPNLPRVRRLGLATRGNTHLRPDDVAHAIDRGLNYLNWCAHPDGMSRAIAEQRIPMAPGPSTRIRSPGRIEELTTVAL